MIARISTSGRRLLATFACAAGLLLVAVTPSTAAASQPLQTAVVDYGAFNTPSDISTAFAHARAAGATAVRLYVVWRLTAPFGSTKPAGFDAANPADPQYFWTLIDQQVTTAVRMGLQPILAIESAPDWAQGQGDGLRGTVRPDPGEFALFARAIATRYSGSFGGLPRVRYWQAWNEPNYFRHLSPQYDTPQSEPVGPNSQLLSPGIYRPLLNSFYAAVHAVRADNVVITGGLAPFGNENANTHVARTLPFMRALLCMGADNRPLPGCTEKTSFDIWAHHPYTAGGPTHRNRSSEDVSLGDLPKMRRLLDAAIRAGHVVSSGKVRFWATEISWDSNPPDPNAVPMGLLQRWIPEALYRMWTNGISLVAWFQIRDDTGISGDNLLFQSGLYFTCSGGITCDRPKPTLQAFRFPFVAYPASRGRVLVWGRTPAGKRGSVGIEQKVGRRWQKLGSLSSDGVGIFTARLHPRGRGNLRARLAGKAGKRSAGITVSYSLTEPPDRTVNPFG